MPTFRFSLRMLLLSVTAFAIILSLYRTGGRGAMDDPLLVGVLVGGGTAFLVRRKLRWFAALAVAGALLGSVVASEFAILTDEVSVEKLNAPPVIPGKTELEPILLGRWAFCGAVPGAAVGLITGWWLAMRKRDNPGDFECASGQHATVAKSLRDRR